MTEGWWTLASNVGITAVNSTARFDLMAIEAEEGMERETVVWP